MRQQNQLVDHAPHLGRFGDCYRTSMANLLGVPAGIVPHVAHDGCRSEVAFGRMEEWLSYWGLGHATIAFPDSDLDKVLNTVDFCRQPVLLTGCSSPGVAHTVVAFRGHIYHDPFGVQRLPLTQWEGHWYIDFITALVRRHDPRGTCAQADERDQVSASG